MGSRWKHSNGIEYTVKYIANIAHKNPKYPVSVVYQGSNGNVWVKTIERFYETMEEI